MNNSFVVAAWLVATALPLISACGGRLGDGSFASRYVRSLGLYITGTVFVYVGYFSQALITGSATAQAYNTGWKGIVAVTKGIDNSFLVPQVVIVSGIICCAVSFASRKLSRAVVAFRASFLTYVAFDIIIGIAARYELEDYILALVCDFVGSFLFGAVFAVIVQSFLPPEEFAVDAEVLPLNGRTGV